MLGLLLLGLIIMLGGAPDHDRRGFRYITSGAGDLESSVANNRPGTGRKAR
jgi:hypothetical protein